MADTLADPNIMDNGYLDPILHSKDLPNPSQIFNPIGSIFSSGSGEYKANLPTPMESQIRKLKLSLEPYRELMLHANKVVLWEKQWHSTGILAATSVVFTIIWLQNPNMLSMVAFMGLLITIADCFMPTVLSSIYTVEMWSGEKQKEYEEICTSIILYKTKAELLMSSYWRMRVTNPKLYFGLTISMLVLLTFVGGTIDNLLLTYAVVTFGIMLPGMIHHGMLNKFTEACSKLFNSLVENAKAKVGPKKLQ
ncbi:ADP-ribosylation factor-like protein 6-interacting protein 1 [Anthonomus grandis grandis]|uniref:ADP-ribosylation factor-like protein 6-interacting protein 1 n=1 Tax=Anthonomus grandis grandis TaxID=2921223 RepID=UPI002165FA34|nr:ADP-ribosylation factor-like protein 6-interacting protein 1 [Anthonomus grandis grandis]